MEKLTVNQSQIGRRLDQLLSGDVSGATRSQVQKWIKEGKVTVNEATVRASYAAQEGDVITWEKPDPVPIDAVPQDIPLCIVYEDDALLVINKPRGMVVHPAPGNPDQTLVNAVLFHTRGALSGVGGALRPGIVHRIDKDTTGLLVVAKNDEAHQALSSQLKTRELKREYLTLVHGSFSEDSGSYTDRLDRDPADRKKYRTVREGGRDAQTDFFVEERFSGYTLLRCSLVTGRTHQIRVHMKYHAHPVVGDKTYGAKSEPFSLAGQLLHARAIRFIHPVTKEKMEFFAPLPDDFEKTLLLLRRRQSI